MKSAASDLSVWVGETMACVKIAGRACVTCSVDFKALVTSLARKGISRIILDLGECLLMDSTFLGVLTGLGLRMGAGAARNGDPEISLELLNPSDRVLGLLENLGVTHLFKILKGTDPRMEKMASVETTASDPDRKETCRTSLQAHELLMELNPANVPKFKDVAQFLAEELKKLEGADGK